MAYNFYSWPRLSQVCREGLPSSFLPSPTLKWEVIGPEQLGRKEQNGIPCRPSSVPQTWPLPPPSPYYVHSMDTTTSKISFYLAPLLMTSPFSPLEMVTSQEVGWFPQPGFLNWLCADLPSQSHTKLYNLFIGMAKSWDRVGIQLNPNYPTSMRMFQIIASFPLVHGSINAARTQDITPHRLNLKPWHTP